MIEQPKDLGLVDRVNDAVNNTLDGILFSLRIYQTFFGKVSTLDEFLGYTEGDITIKQLVRKGPSAARYPIEFILQYSGAPSRRGPLFGRKLKYYERVGRMVREEYSKADKRVLHTELRAIIDERRTELKEYGRLVIESLTDLPEY